MKCIICNNKNTKLIFSKFPGYIENTYYKIYQCDSCNSQFINTNNINLNIYDKIYSNINFPGYDRYLEFAKKIKLKKDPLHYLASQEEIYFACEFFLKNKPKQKILEIGCGYGYLTYALNKEGHNTTGIDISKKAIQFAKKNFGKKYFSTTIENYNYTKKYDLIIATELIEHLINPNKFIQDCKKHMSKNGVILITTPNKNYYKKGIIWKTDLPPIHTMWLSKNSFKHLANNNQLNMQQLKLKKINVNDPNNLVHLFLPKKQTLPNPILNKKYELIPPIDKKTKLKQIFSKIINQKNFKLICNKIHKIISPESKTLNIILKKEKI